MITTAAASLFAAMFALLLAWTAGALVRTALRAQENRVAQQRAEAEAVAEQERVRIARDMHDVVAHSLAVVVAQADGARYAAASDPSVATDALGTISTTARAALSDVRLLLTQLRHSEGDGPQPTLADLEQLYAQLRAAGVELVVDVDPAWPGTPPASIQLAVFRILQEALTNALRHGGAGPVDVRLAWHANRVAFEVRNALRPGVTAAQPQELESRATDERTRGHGVIGMRERAQLVGGRLDAGARTTVPSSCGEPSRSEAGHERDQGGARRRSGAVPRRHPHARRLAARHRGRGRGARRPRGDRRRARLEARRRADGHPNARARRPRCDSRAPARRRPAPHRHAHDVRPRRGGSPRDPAGCERVSPEGCRPRVPPRGDPYGACRIGRHRSIRHP